MTKGMLPPKIMLSVVRYGDPQVVCALVARLGQSTARDQVLLAVADNGPGVSAELERLNLTEAVDHLVVATDNPGYFPSAFAAVSEALTDDIRWAIVANPDMDIDLVEATRVLCTNWDDRQALIVVPQVLENNGRESMNPHIIARPGLRWFTIRALIHSTYLSHLIFMWLHKRRRSGMPQAPKPANDSSLPMYAPHGSIVALSRPAFDLLVPEARQAILYSEEIWLGEHCLRLGVDVRLDPNWTVRHESHSSTGTLTARSRQRLWRRATVRSLKLRSRLGGQVQK